MTFAKEIAAPYELVVKVAEEGKLPVLNLLQEEWQHQLMLH